MSDVLTVVEFGDGPTFVLLHAFPCTGQMWRPQAEALAEAGWQVLVPDLPGFGSSELPDAEPSLTTVAELLLAELDDRGVDRCVMGGISLGGYLTMAVAAMRPEILTGVALCDTKATPDGEVARENRERLARMCEETPTDTARILEQAVLPGLLGDTTRSSRPGVVDLVTGWLGSARAESVAWYQRAMADRPDSRVTLGALDVPSVVIWGDEDALSPREEQDLMVASLASPTLVVVENSGHLSSVERPSMVSDALVAFARQI